MPVHEHVPNKTFQLRTYLAVSLDILACKITANNETAHVMLIELTKSSSHYKTISWAEIKYSVLYILQYLRIF
jgi:hypothetical protein